MVLVFTAAVVTANAAIIGMGGNAVARAAEGDTVG